MADFILINKHNLAAVLPAVSKEQSRYTLQAVHITESYTEATDGHRLIRVTVPKVDAVASNPTNYPKWDGFKPQGFAPMLLDVETAKQVAKAIPKKQTIPVLCHAAVSVKDDAIQVAVTDLQSPQVFTPRKVTGQFPNTGAVLDGLNKREPTVRIQMDAKKLMEVLRSAAEFMADDSHHRVTLELWDKDTAIRMTAKDGDSGQEWLAIMMPLVK